MHDDLAALFADYAARGAGDDAPAHRILAEAVAGRADILAVVAAAPEGRRHPNNLFAAVRFLLFGGVEHPLADSYRDVTAGHLGHGDDLVERFADFVHTHHDAVLEAMAFRGIQTNEPARCAQIAAGLAVVQGRHGPLALLDVGTSAGLNLQVDRCRIDYTRAGAAGDAGTAARSIGPVDSPLHLSCRLLGDGVPPVDREPLTIGWRRGLDRDPIDLGDEPSRRWLQSCIWIDQVDRSERLAQAIDLARTHPEAITTGDAIDDLGAVIAGVPDHLHLVVLTTWVTYYLSDAQRAAFDAALADARRPVSWLSLEYPRVVTGIDRPADTPSEQITPSVLGLVSHDGAGGDRREFLAWAHHHGTWLDWRAGGR